jgi:hypothetical protein
METDIKYNFMFYISLLYMCLLKTVNTIEAMASWNYDCVGKRQLLEIYSGGHYENG